MMTLSHPKEAPRADPHAGCCGSRGRENPGDPIGLRRHDVSSAQLSSANLHRRSNMAREVYASLS